MTASPDDTLDPAADAEATQPPQPLDRSLFVRIPIHPSVPDSVTADPEAVDGMCQLLAEGIKDSLRAAQKESGDMIFDVDRVEVAYDTGADDGTFAGVLNEEKESSVQSPPGEPVT
jgi:hypothetical protein